MGSPDFACYSLSALLNTFPKAKIDIFSQPDKAKGRSKKLCPTEVKEMACKHNLPVHTPSSKDEIVTLVQKIDPDVIIVVAYGIIIPKTITDTYTCINVHGSLLPKYRGASPVQAALLNGDTVTGITLIKINEKMDAGPILKSASMPIDPDINFEILYKQLAKLGANTLATYLSENWPLGSEHESAQEETESSYCQKIQKEDTQLLKSDTPETKHNKIRAFSPKPGAFIFHNDKRLKILKSTLLNGQCIPEIVQPEGKKAMSFHDYCLGNPSAKEILNA